MAIDSKIVAQLKAQKRREFYDGTFCSERSKTRQSEADQADINLILSRAELGGVIPLVKRQGEYLDVSEVGDYRQAREQVRLADEYFMSLPAQSRGIFNNDPAEFLDAVGDPARLQDLIDAGVIPKGEVAVPSAPPVVPEGGAGAPVSAAPKVS